MTLGFYKRGKYYNYNIEMILIAYCKKTQDRDNFFDIKHRTTSRSDYRNSLFLGIKASRCVETIVE